MKITDVTVDTLSYPVKQPFWSSRGGLSPSEGGRQHRARGMALVRVHTDEGIVGIGESGLCGAPGPVVAAAIEQYLKPLVVGEEPFYVERLWNKVYQHIGGSGRRGFLVAAYSGIDIALWDIIGKSLGVPVYKVLGGYRDRAPAYASAGFYSEGKTREDLAAEMQSYLAEGFQAFKMKIGGVSLAEDTARVKAVRHAIGDGYPLMVDANNVYSPKEAIQLARAIERFDIAWFEEPVPTDDLDGSAHVAASISIPVAGYETEFTRYGYRELITRRAIDVAQPDVTWTGGFTEWRRIAALADAYDLPCVPHAFSSAVTMAASLHLLGSSPRSGMLEFDRNPHGLREELITVPFRIESDGMVSVPQGPGLGIELNEDTVEKYRL